MNAMWRSVMSAACAFIVLLPALAWAQAGYRDIPPPSFAMANGVTWRPDIAYSVVSGYRPLKFDLYLPPDKGPLRPLVIYLHGGGWSSGHPRVGGTFTDFPAVLGHIAAKGYVVAGVSYRLSGEAKFPAALHDVKTALRFLRAHAVEYGVDPNRVILWGASAGGHLAALTALSCKDADLALPGGVLAASDCVQGVVDWYGISDVKAWAEEDPKPESRGREAVEGFLGCPIATCDPALFKKASPLGFVDAQAPPFLIQAGDQDSTVSVEESKALQAALRAKGVKAELVIYSGIGHSFANAPPATERVNTDVNAEAVEKLLEFLARTTAQ